MTRHNSDRLRRVISGRWNVSGGIKSMMLRALDDVDRGVVPAGRHVVRKIIADLRAMGIRRKSRESGKEDGQPRDDSLLAA